jgi:hypothetical protein
MSKGCQNPICGHLKTAHICVVWTNVKKGGADKRGTCGRCTCDGFVGKDD